MAERPGLARVTGAWGRLDGFWRTALALILIYVFLRFAFGYVSQLIMGTDSPLPIPSKLLSMYVALAILALGVQVLVSDESLRAFLDPAQDLLRGPKAGDPRASSTPYRIFRMAVLAVPPVLVALAVYQQLAPKVASAATTRQQHPTLPAAFESLDNPFRSEPEAVQQQAAAEGLILYQRNCRPCHGTPARGDGPMALGFRPRPIAFTDPGTIETIVEPYMMWRIERGGLGLPPEATPWNSAMPPWEGELTRDEIWKIVMAEYNLASKEPRIPESHQ